MKKILNIAAGKMPPLPDLIEHSNANFIVNLDTMYFHHTPVETIERDWGIWQGYNSKTYYCKEDAFEFMERSQMTFDIITIYRFLEHVSFTQVLYFIYLLSTTVNKGGIVDVIVPNYHTLAEMLYQDDVNDPEFEERNILLTTELLNEPSAPHASIWTPQRAGYFFEYEGRFMVSDDNIDPHFVYDGRNIYLRFQAQRV